MHLHAVRILGMSEVRSVVRMWNDQFVIAS
jgi:hypothetical protein